MHRDAIFNFYGVTCIRRPRSDHLDIRVRQAIIGFRPWNTDDLITELQFSLSDTNGLLTAPDIQNAITSANFENPPESKILEAESNGTTVTISFSYTRGWHGGNFQVAGMIGNVVFEDAKTIDELRKLVGVLRTFFTMAAGIEVWLSDYQIVPKVDHEQPLVGGSGSSPAHFQLIWPRGKEEPPVDYGSFKPPSVLHSWESSDRKTTSDCLKFWMNNWAEWQHAFSGVVIAIQAGVTFDPNRIVNACKWLESTPGAQQMRLDRKVELDAISAAAIARANEFGLTINDRISRAIKRLGTESRNDLFKRLIELVISEGDPALKTRFRKDLHKAYRIRGDFAHSKFFHSTSEEFGDFVRVVNAVEALAFLLLFRQLPLPEDHPKSLRPGGFTEYFSDC